jgi:type II secretory pathway component PulK
MIMALVFMLVLAAMVMALAYYVTSETRGIGFQLDDTKTLYLAQAGVERAFREIRNDFLTTSQQGVADLRGSDTAGSVSIGNLARIRYIGEGTGLGGSATINANGDIAQLQRFDSNYTQTQIISVFLFVRASRATGGTGATLQVSYSTTGGFPQPGSTALTWALPNTTTLSVNSVDITADRTWTWPTIMNAAFALRAQRTAGNRNVNLDAIWLRVTYTVDTDTEPWFTGTYDVFPKTLGDGFIQSVSIADEARKVHLNYASQLLLRWLMQEHGVAAGTATTVATNIVNYRGAALTNPFDSIEELQRVTGMTQTIYNLIKDYVTVYSFINTNSYRPPSATTATSRAPVNINTAPREVLEAIFDPLSLGGSDPASLATDILDNRPFTCFYHFDTAVTSDFYDFVLSRGYLSPAERNRVLDNADASSLVPQAGAGAVNGVTTEFCYANTVYKIESVGKITVPGDITSDINLRVKTIVGNDGSRTFQNYTGDTTSTGYWKENYE